MYSTLQSAQHPLNDRYNRTLDVLAMSIGGAPINGGIAMEETWKDVVGYEGLYQVSSLGRIKNNKGKVLKQEISSQGYLRIKLRKNKQSKSFHVHRIELIAFTSPNKNMQVNHIDGDKNNNRLENLSWCTASENIRHAIKLGLFKQCFVSDDVRRKKHTKKFMKKISVLGRKARYGW